MDTQRASVLPVGVLMRPDFVAVEPWDTIGEAAEKMSELDVGSALVIDAGQLVGILTSRVTANSSSRNETTVRASRWSAAHDRPKRSRSRPGSHSPPNPIEPYFSENPGWQLMFVPRATVIFEGSAQPGSPRQPWKLELAAGRASSRTTVPVRKKLEHVPDPLPFVIVQLIPAGCDVITPLPLPPGTIEMLPWV